jgi:hypothetical protein
VQARYRDRRPVEGLLWWAKQMLGAVRQGVFVLTRRQRFRALTLLPGSILAYTAPMQPALPTGCSDWAAQPTSGRLHRVLAHVHGENVQELPEPFANTKRLP